MSETLTLEVLQQAVAGHAAAFRFVTGYQPAGGVGDKVFPPTSGSCLYQSHTVDQIFRG